MKVVAIDLGWSWLQYTSVVLDLCFESRIMSRVEPRPYQVFYGSIPFKMREETSDTHDL
jgi:hypothetical protein